MKKLQNGDLKTWMLGAALAALLTMGGYLYTGVQDDQRSISTTMREIQQELQAQGQRVAGLQTQQPTMDRRLERLEEKIDTLLQTR